MKTLLSKFISWFAHRGSVTATIEYGKDDLFYVCINGVAIVAIRFYEQVAEITLLGIDHKKFPKTYRPTGNKILKETIIKK